MLEEFHRGPVEGYNDFIELAETIPFKFLDNQIRRDLLQAFDEPVMNNKTVYYTSEASILSFFTMVYDNGDILIMKGEKEKKVKQKKQRFMRVLLVYLLAFVAMSCSHNSDDSIPSPPQEKVTIHWSLKSSGKNVDGSIRVDVITHDGKKYGTDSKYNNVYLQLDKGDYVTFMVTAYPEDQAQNEAGIDCEYSVIGYNKRIITEGTTYGTSFLIK